MNAYYEPMRYTVTAEEDGHQLKTILKTRFQLSRKLLSKLKLTEAGISINGNRVYISERVHTGDLVEIRMQQEESEDILPQEMPLSIIYEDDHLLIVNKPAGLIVHPTHGHYTGTLANGVVHYWRERGEKCRFRPIHRLDQDTSGVLAIAKNPYAHQNVSEQMKENRVLKEYLAFVYGQPQDDAGTIDAPIDRDPEHPHVRIVIPSGYRSVTHFEVVTRYAGAALVKLRLETGRTHQIRVHMKHIGHPLVGDTLYVPERWHADWPELQMPRQALHAVRLGFQHPSTRQPVLFEAPLPDDLQSILERVRPSGTP